MWQPVLKTRRGPILQDLEVLKPSVSEVRCRMRVPAFPESSSLPRLLFEVSSRSPHVNVLLPDS